MSGPIISVTNLCLDLRIGVLEVEQKFTQKVNIEFNLTHSSLPQECIDDSSSEYICYADLVRSIQNYCENKSFGLIEYLCFQLYQLLKSKVEKNILVRVKVQKLRVDIDGINCSPACEFGD